MPMAPRRVITSVPALLQNAASRASGMPSCKPTHSAAASVSPAPVGSTASTSMPSATATCPSMLITAPSLSRVSATTRGPMPCSARSTLPTVVSPVRNCPSLRVGATMSAFRTAQSMRWSASPPESSWRMLGSKDTSTPFDRAISTSRSHAPRIWGVSSSSIPGKCTA